MELMQYIGAQLSTLKMRLEDGEKGQTLVEYALILALVSIASIAALGVLSGKINGVFTTVSNAL